MAILDEIKGEKEIFGDMLTIKLTKEMKARLADYTKGEYGLMSKIARRGVEMVLDKLDSEAGK